MEEAKIAARQPAVLELEPGKTYKWCACGLSAKQPFCDGSHRTTAIVNKPFTVEEKKNYALCQCKRTGNGPFCDGTHKTLPV